MIPHSGMTMVICPCKLLAHLQRVSACTDNDLQQNALFETKRDVIMRLLHRSVAISTCLLSAKKVENAIVPHFFAPAPITFGARLTRLSSVGSV